MKGIFVGFVSSNALHEPPKSNFSCKKINFLDY